MGARIGSAVFGVEAGEVEAARRTTVGGKCTIAAVQVPAVGEGCRGDWEKNDCGMRHGCSFWPYRQSMVGWNLRGSEGGEVEPAVGG